MRHVSNMASTSLPGRFPSIPRRTTRWVVYEPTRMAGPAFLVCSPPGKLHAPACMAQTGLRVILCWKDSCSALEQAKVMRESCGSNGHARRRHSEAEVYPRMTESRVRQITWEYCGISRDAAGLNKAKQILESVGYKTVFNQRVSTTNCVTSMLSRC